MRIIHPWKFLRIHTLRHITQTIRCAYQRRICVAQRYAVNTMIRHAFELLQSGIFRDAYATRPIIAMTADNKEHIRIFLDELLNIDDRLAAISPASFVLS